MAEINNITSLKIVKIKTPPKVDGQLDDKAWEESSSITSFKRYNVKEGQPPTEKTEVKIVYDDKNIYFAIRCSDKIPKGIRANISKRDNGQEDDNVSIYLDTFNSKTRGYYFNANAYGIQSDGYRNGATNDLTRDFIFESKGRIDEKGWTLEAKIPFKSLRFRPGKTKKWGLVITRYIARKDESVSFPPLSRKILDILPQAQVIELKDIKRGYGLDLIPYAAGGYGWTKTNDQIEGKKVLNFGGDIRFGPTPDLSINLTANPDHSQIESDENQLSLNRRTEIYYPEKRPFFLEGNDTFVTPLELFYSRRIVNPLFGGKMSGQIGNLNLGILSVYDRDEQGNSIYNLGRFKFDFAPQSHIGTTIIDKESLSDQTKGFYNRIVSVDAKANFLEHYEASFQAALSYAKNQIVVRDKHFLHADIKLDDGTFYLSAWYDEFAPGFANESGYTGLDDQAQKNGRRSPGQLIKYTFRPENAVLKSWKVGAINSLAFGFNNSMQERSTGSGVNFYFEKNISLISSVYNDSEVFRGKNYGKTYFSSVLSSTTSKYLSASFGLNHFGTEIKYDFGHYADPADEDDSFLGWKIAYGGKAQFKPLKRLNIELSFDNERFYDKLGGSLIYSAWVGGLKTRLQFTREAFFKSFVQADTQKRTMEINALFGYMLNHGTVLYLGYNDTISEIFGGAYSSDRSVFAKAAYLFSL